MGKKNSNTKLKEEEVSDDILLNEDLDDPILAEAEAIFGKLNYKRKKIKQAPKNETAKSKIPVKKEKRAEKLKKPSINKETLKQLSLFLQNKSKIYEEISFETVLRKIPQSWNFTQSVLIDVLEVIIENNAVQTVKMKMTANSLKFYPNIHPQDKNIINQGKR